MSDLLSEQYDLVRKTREILFGFFENIPVDKLHVEVPQFGFSTIARTHFHVAGCYIHWLVKFAGIRSNPEFPTEEEIRSADVAALRLDLLTYGNVDCKFIFGSFGGVDMKLTQRRKDFLDRLIDIYTRTAKPVHYETLAQEVGVSKWTAYDMLQALEKTGFLAREYVLHSAGGGRSQIVYVPTQNAYDTIGKPRTDFNIEESVETAMEKFSRWMERLHTDEIMGEMMEAIQTAQSQVEYCLYVLGLLIFVLKGTNEETVRFIKHFVLQTPSESMRLATFTGAVVGNVLTSINSELSLQVVDLIGGFLKEVNGLSDESKRVLSEFLVQALSSI